MLRLALPFALALLACASARPPEAPPDDRELVVLVHGMGRTPLSMVPLGVALRRAGYRTLNVGYDSQGPGVEALGRELAAAVHAETARAPASAVHFVGHSLGGLLSRWVLAHDPPPGAGRAVLLASPGAGSAAADRWAWLLRFGLPPIAELTTGAPFEPGPLPPGVGVAVIAGDADGKVSPDEARLPGADATCVVPSGHTAIMWRPRVIRLVTAFLGTGELSPSAGDCAAEL